MKATITESFPGASAETLFEHIATLDRYPPWMRLVHRVTPMAPDEQGPAWWVELRARIGPFTRSKQLRMVRTKFVDNERVRFERVEHDERDHAEWILVGEVAEADDGADLTMHLEYTGELWSMNVLGRILDDEVRRSTAALAELLSELPTR
jgi:Polyketide cyclase / dehydrase and lipid transport